MSGEDIKKFALTVVVTTVTSLTVFAAAWGALSSRVDANEEKLKQMVPRAEHEQILKWQIRFEDLNEKRMTRLENKLDTLLERSK